MDMKYAIYCELQGMLAEARQSTKGYIAESSIWEHYDLILKQLEETTGEESFSRFKLRVYPGAGGQAMDPLGYKSKLVALINFLNGMYFSAVRKAFCVFQS